MGQHGISVKIDTPKQVEKIAFALVAAASVIVIAILAIILEDIIVHGLPSHGSF